MPANSAKMPKKAMPKKFAGKSTKLGGGGRFAMLSSKVKAGEKKEGKSEKTAERIAGAVAAKVGQTKYGKAKMEKMSIAGKKRASAKK